jgi:predicted PurR-regulated permease PerM
MALPARDQLKYWSVAIVVFAVVLWFLGDVLLPVVLGAAVAYFVDPVADRLERMGMSRTGATATITVAAVLLTVVLVLSVLPMLISQLIDLAQVLPQLLRDLRAYVSEQFPSLLDQNSRIHQALTVLGDTLNQRAGVLLETFIGSALSFINLALLVVIVPVVSVYLLLDWDRMIARIDELMPRDHAPVIRRISSEIDATLSAFVRGMGTVCLILGTYYAVALMLVGLQFGLAVGFIAGLVTFIPYLGALIGGALAIGLALFQFWGDWVSIGLVAGIFAIGQVIEGNILTPKLVGGSVGLHPVWLLLALSVFGTLFGFVGMLVAVPVAADLGVVARFVVAQYLDSRLYQGKSHRDAEPD